MSISPCHEEPKFQDGVQLKDNTAQLSSVGCYNNQLYNERCVVVWPNLEENHWVLDIYVKAYLMSFVIPLCWFVLFCSPFFDCSFKNTSSTQNTHTRIHVCIYIEIFDYIHLIWKICEAMLKVTVGVSLESYSGYHSIREPVQYSYILEQKY